jgi:hypothetical protein
MDILLPTNDAFIEQVAKAIARERLYRESTELLKQTIGLTLPDNPALDQRFDQEFELLWDSTDADGEWERESYNNDARAAINKINLLLLTMPE